MSRRPGPRARPEAASKPVPRARAAERAFEWPDSSALLDPRAPWLLPALVLVASRLVLASTIPFAAEDAYITFRFARNLAHGFGLVFNPGERVFGFSSPLWTVWMALGIKLGAAPVLWARLSTLAMELVTLVVVTAMLRRQVSNAAAWCFAAFFAIWPYFGAVSVSGMENLFMVGWIALAAAWSARRSPMAGPALAALAVTRPEALASALVLGLRASWRDRLVAAALVLAAVWALAAYFGSPVPQSLVAKSQVYGTPGPWAARYWWDWLLPFVIGRFTSVSDTGHLFLLSVVLAPAVWYGAKTLWKDKSSPLAAFVGACLVVWAGYALLGVAYFWWYLAVPLAGFAALAAAGFPRLGRGPALYVSAGLLAAGLWTVVPQLYLGRAQSEYLGFGAVGSYLSTHAQPGEKVMLEPIGMVGYQAPVVVVDEVGLVSPQVARRRVQGPGWYTDVAAQERPDWLVVRRGVLTGGRAFAGAGAPFRSLGERDSLLARYSLEAQMDTVSGDNRLWVLRRRR